MSTERTYIMIKPEGIERSLVHKIIKRFECRGFKLVGLKLAIATFDTLVSHYSDLMGKEFFNSLISGLQNKTVICMVWEGKDVIAQSRIMLGSTNPLQSAPGTIRGDYSIDIDKNVVHASDSLESAKKEIELWFPTSNQSAVGLIP